MKRSYIVLVFAAVMFTACSKDSTQPTSSNGNTTNTSANDAISTSDVTEAVTNAVSGSTSGLATQSETTAQLASSCSIPCGTTSDTTISGASAQNLPVTYNYNLNFSRTPVCSNGALAQLNATCSGTMGYSVILMSSGNTINAQISVSGLDASSPAYVLNETYVLKGTQQSFILNQHSFSSTLTITSNNISVSKSTKKIVSGEANVQFNGTSSGGATARHTATITFLGNDQASLVVDNGTAKTISW